MGFWLTRYLGGAYMPHLFGSPVPVVEIGASAVGTHLAGTMICGDHNLHPHRPDWLRDR